MRVRGARPSSRACSSTRRRRRWRCLRGGQRAAGARARDRARERRRRRDRELRHAGADDRRHGGGLDRVGVRARVRPRRRRRCRRPTRTSPRPRATPTSPPTPASPRPATRAAARLAGARRRPPRPARTPRPTRTRSATCGSPTGPATARCAATWARWSCSRRAGGRSPATCSPTRARRPARRPRTTPPARRRRSGRAAAPSRSCATARSRATSRSRRGGSARRSAPATRSSPPARARATPPRRSSTCARPRRRSTSAAAPPLSALLGGYRGSADGAIVEAEFRDPAGRARRLQIGPVTAGDRGGATNLLPRSISGAMPPLTRSVAVTLRSGPAAGGYDDAYFDSVALVPRASAAARTATRARAAGCACSPASRSSRAAPPSTAAAAPGSGSPARTASCAAARGPWSPRRLSRTGEHRVARRAFSLRRGRVMRLSIALSRRGAARSPRAAAPDAHIYVAARDGQGLTRTSSSPPGSCAGAGSPASSAARAERQRRWVGGRRPAPAGLDAVDSGPTRGLRLKCACAVSIPGTHGPVPGLSRSDEDRRRGRPLTPPTQRSSRARQAPASDRARRPRGEPGRRERPAGTRPG